MTRIAVAGPTSGKMWRTWLKSTGSCGGQAGAAARTLK
jgi:hypothetical protein